MVSHGNLIIGSSILFLVPFLTQIYYYRITKISDYLIFSTVFLSASLSQLLVILNSPPNIILRVLIDITFILALFPLFEITRRTRGNSYIVTKTSRNILVITTLSLMIILDLINVQSGNDLTPLRIVVSDIFRLFVSLYMFKTFGNLKLPVRNARSKMVKIFWIVTSGLLIVVALIRILFYGSLSYFLLVDQVINLPFSSFQVDFLVDILILIVSAITFVMGVMFPELMLISSHTLLQTNQLYTLVTSQSKATEEDSSILNQIDPKDVIMSYLDQIKEDIKSSER